MSIIPGDGPNRDIASLISLVSGKQNLKIYLVCVGFEFEVQTLNEQFRQELTVVRASCVECGGDGGKSHKLDFGETEKLVRMGCVTVAKFDKRWNIEDGCFSYDSVRFGF